MMKKRRLKILIVNAVLLAIAAVCFITCFALPAKLESQRAAERWTGDSELAFEQLSCYMSETDALGIEDIYTFRQTLTTKLTEASIETPENGSLYHDAWSATGKLTVFGEHGSGEASVIAVGGDYFFFHPLRLLSGSYISEDDVMDDRVVLDRELAWRLFGGVDLQGMTVTINGTPYVVAGVVEREQDSASTRAYNGGSGLYMSYSAYNNISTANIECYEIVMPQPVEGFAEDILNNSFKIGGGEIVNNSRRFTFSSIFKIVKDFGTRSMHTNSVIYPYWENAARYLSDWCALFLLLGLLFAVSPVITAFVTLLIYLIKGKDYLAEHVPEWTSGAVDRSRQKRYARKRGAHEKPRPVDGKRRKTDKKSKGKAEHAENIPEAERVPDEEVEPEKSHTHV